eukprot:2619264-Heterocapsa_arctica.AAC.1
MEASLGPFPSHALEHVGDFTTGPAAAHRIRRLMVNWGSPPQFAHFHSRSRVSCSAAIARAECVPAEDPWRCTAGLHPNV